MESATRRSVAVRCGHTDRVFSEAAVRALRAACLRGAAHRYSASAEAQKKPYRGGSAVCARAGNDAGCAAAPGPLGRRERLLSARDSGARHPHGARRCELARWGARPAAWRRVLAAPGAPRGHQSRGGAHEGRSRHRQGQAPVCGRADMRARWLRVLSSAQLRGASDEEVDLERLMYSVSRCGSRTSDSTLMRSQHSPRTCA